MTHFVFDVDGVLADLVDQVRGLLGLQHFDPPTYNLTDHLTERQWAEVGLGFQRPFFWVSMPPIHGGLRALEALPPESVTVVSQPPPGVDPEAFAKLRGDWIESLTRLRGVTVIPTSDPKDRAKVDGDVLIDDNLENIEEWEATGRKAILVAHRYNQGADASLGRVSPEGLLPYLIALRNCGVL